MSDTKALKEKAALLSIAASALLTLGKLVAGLLSGSLALLSEAGHGLLDTGATILTYFAIKAADQPADDEHHFGHAKIEAVAALAETGLLFVLAIGVLVEAARRLAGIEIHTVDANWLAFAVLIVSIIVDFIRWRSLTKIAHDTKSDALAADALHFSSDLVGSALVLIGLIAVQFGFIQGDAFASIGVAAFIAIAGYRLGRRTIDTLVDTAPVGISDRIKAIVENITGVVGIDFIRLRPAGPQIIGEVGIFVPRTMALEDVALVKDEVTNAILSELPEVLATITANPRALDDESVLERVLLVAARRRLPVHHVTVQEIDGIKSVSLDVELDGRMEHVAAHDIASSLEHAIADEIGDNIEVETHIEPLEVQELSGRDVCDIWGDGITRSLIQNANIGGTIVDVHNVRVREASGGLVVNYHCRVNGHLTVDQVHEAVDLIDHKVRLDFPKITRVVGHAEPIR